MTNKMDDLIKSLSELTVMEAIELKNKLEETWGVSAQVAVAAGPAQASEAVEEKTEFDVVIKSFPAPAKMKLMLCLKKDPIKMEMAQIKEVTANEQPNYTVMKGLDKEAAEAVAKVLKDTGAVVEVK